MSWGLGGGFCWVYYEEAYSRVLGPTSLSNQQQMTNQRDITLEGETDSGIYCLCAAT